MSVPFITTSVGVEGLDFKHDESCLVADTAEEFANAIDCLANDAVLRKRLTENASKVFENKYSAQALSDVRDNIYCNVVKNNVM
jgi:glycosyltransferase involved in cell wall biosynthesis